MATDPGAGVRGVADTGLLKPEEIAEKVCDNRDLLAVSRGVASLPTLAVGTVLGNLDDADITTVEEDPEIPMPCDKMYQLLHTWKTKGDGAHTWANLLECLKKLPSPEALMERVKSSLRRMMAKAGTTTFSCGVEAAYKELRNVECSDLDLHCMSLKVAQHSVHVIGACLRLDESLVKRIACSSAHPNRRSRIYDLLLQWRRKSGVRSTLPALHACLVWLENKALLEGVERYIVDAHRCSSIPKTKLQVCSTMPMQETSSNARASLPHNLSLEIPGDDDDAATPSSGWWPQPFEETFHDRHKSVMVYNSSNYQPPNVSFHEEFAALQSEFSFLQSKVYENLKERKVAVDTVQQFVNSLSVSQQENIPLFNEHMQEMIAYSSLKEIFGFLTRIGVWCFLNFRILEEIVKYFGSGDLQDKIDQYQKKVDRFKSTTKLSDFLQVWSGRRFHTNPHGSEGMIPVLVKFEAAWHDCTLSDVAEKERFLANEFLLHKSIFQLATMKPGCVTVMWLVPFSVLKAVKAIVRERLPDLRKANIEELIVGNLLFVQDCVALEPVSYPHLYKYSIDHPEKFWGERAKKFLVWDEPFTRVTEEDSTRWFAGGKLNVTRSVLDRHVMKSPDRVALIWEPNEPQKETIRVTYRELYKMTCRVANVLKSHKIAKGDVVTIYMPAMPLTVACMLACARIGAIHSVIFPALRGSPLKDRIKRAKSKAVITATTARLGNKELRLKYKLDAALEGNEKVQYVFVASSPEDQLRKLLKPSALTTGDPCAPYLKLPRDIDLMKEISKASPECKPVSMESEESLFLMFTSGSSAEPKIITHSQAGYLLYAAVTHKHIFDYQPGDVFACVADFGWVMAHSYVVYGPLCNGATTVLFGSTATYPDPGRYWDMVERLKINQLYMSTSAVKRLMQCDMKHIRDHDLSSLRTVATGGEPLSREAWRWYHNVVGRMRCTLVDAWWQTETGGINIAPLPAYECSPLKPGFVMKPFFGVQPVIVNDKMEEVECGEQGHLCLKKALPGMGREVDRKRDTFRTTYFDKGTYTGLYKTHDWGYCDSDGDYRITGRASDKVWSRIQGVWLDVPEIECLMTSHPKVKTATLVGTNVVSGDPKTFAFVKMNEDVSSKEDRRVVIKELKEKLKADEVPEEFAVIDKEPKTQSGKPAYEFLGEVAKELERDRDNRPTATEGGAFDDQLNPDEYIDKVRKSKAHLEICCH